MSKAGSTTMKAVLTATLLHTKRQMHNGIPYWPNATEFTRAVNSMQEGDVYVNHASVVPQLGPPQNPDIGWVNIVRDPVARLASLHYYGVDPIHRSEKSATAALATRKADPSGGCYMLEFDACVQAQVDNGVTLLRHLSGTSQMIFFCSMDGPGSGPYARKPFNCTADAALAQVERLYTFVGLTEESMLSLAALEVLLPGYFTRAQAAAKAIPHNAQRRTVLENPWTHTTGSSGSISAVTHDLLKEHWPGYAEEYKFYHGVRKLFWCKVAALGLAPGE